MEEVLKEINDFIQTAINQYGTKTKSGGDKTITAGDLEVNVKPKAKLAQLAIDSFHLLRKATDTMNKLGGIIEDLTEKCATKSENETSVNDIKQAISEEVQRTLPNILKDIVKEVTIERKLNKTWADVVKNAKNDIKEEFGKTFKSTLEFALKENQDDIVQQTITKQESDQQEKERRARNIVITDVVESDKTEIRDKINHDVNFIVKLLDIDESKIVKCYRPGPPIGQGSNSNRTKPRPLVVILETPELAKQYHKFGNGNRIIVDNDQEFWVNQDYTRAERNANYLARQARKRRQKSDGFFSSNAVVVNDNTVANS